MWSRRRFHEGCSVFGSFKDGAVEGFKEDRRLRLRRVSPGILQLRFRFVHCRWKCNGVQSEMYFCVNGGVELNN